MPAPRQWLWFVGLWAAGVGVTAAVGYGIKFWLKQSRVLGAGFFHAPPARGGVGGGTPAVRRTMTRPQ
jgi:hypothetical protein